MNGRKAKELRKLARVIMGKKAEDGQVIPEVAYDIRKPRNAPKEYRGTRFIPVYGSYRGMYRHLKKLHKKGILNGQRSA